MDEARSLRAESVLVVDCQATGATPAHGELLELGWSLVRCDAQASTPPSAHWTRLEGDPAAVSSAVRRLTGWDESCLERAIDATAAWDRLCADAAGARPASPDRASPEPIATVIHYARFELPFLRDVHARAASMRRAPFPLDVVCLHAVAARMLPDLPRKNLRALAGHLGHSPELVRRAGGHVEASAFVWRALVPRLEAAGIATWAELKTWLTEVPAPSSRVGSARGRRVFPLPAARRRALPDGPGVYRFVRPSGDVLYVGKAARLKKRVAGHFTVGRGSGATERALEMLSQVSDVEVTETASVLEAALLETDEIKRLDPPYNVHLKSGDRSAWFARRSWDDAAPSADAAHRVGPLPSRTAIAGIAAMRALLEGEDATDARRASAVGVPLSFAPSAELFDDVWAAFATDHALARGAGTVRARILRVAGQIVPTPAPPSEDAPPGWDADRVRRNLERTIVAEAALVRRSRLLGLLAHASVAFHEPQMPPGTGRLIVLEGAEIATRRDVTADEMARLGAASARVAPPDRLARLRTFDAARYDRLRVLATELRRVKDEGGSALVLVGAHALRTFA